MSKSEYIGVIGAGSFGTSMANLIAENHKVLLYARRPEVVNRINEQRENTNQKIHDKIE